MDLDTGDADLETTPQTIFDLRRQYFLRVMRGDYWGDWNPKVELTWDEAPLATSYNIYWSTSLGVTIETGQRIAGATPGWHHVGRQNDVPYYYVITSVNALGESPTTSTETSATPVASP